MICGPDPASVKLVTVEHLAPCGCSLSHTLTSLLGHVDDEGDVGGVLLGRDGEEPVPGPRLLGDDIHEGPPGPVGDGQQPRRHHLDDTYAEVFIPHCVNADCGPSKLGQELLERKVWKELDIVLHGEVFAQVFEVLEQLPVVLASTASDDDQPRPRPVLLAQDLPQLEHRLDLEDVILLRPELSEAEDPDGLGHVLVPGGVGEVLRVAGRVHLDTPLRHAPTVPGCAPLSRSC